MAFLHRDGVRIHYEVEGDGPPLVFHTGAGGDLEIWRLAGYMERLRAYRRILIDQRGRGRSDRPTSVEAYTLDQCEADVRGVLDALGVESAGFWGYSNGMLVGLALATTHPERVQCLIGTGAMRYRDLCNAPAMDLEAEVAHAVATGGVAEELDRRRQREGEQFPSAIDANVRAGDPRTYAVSGVALFRWRGPKSVLPLLRAPFLILSGEKEDPDRTTETTASHAPKLRVVRIPGCGHLTAFSRSDLTVPIALEFLRVHLH